jgi:hypothetical protein
VEAKTEEKKLQMLRGQPVYSLTVIATVEGDQQNYKFMAKNLGTSEVMMRVELVDPTGAEFIYLLNEAEQEAWAYWDGAWEDVSATFSTY